MTETISSDPTIVEQTTTCRFCLEKIPAAARACSHCGRSTRRWLPILAWVIGVPVALFILMIIIGNNVGPHTFDGSNTTLYQADTLYETGLTDDEADKLVEEIREKADVSHSEAERMAVVFAQNHVDPKLWVEMAQTAVKMKQLQDAGVIPKN